MKRALLLFSGGLDSILAGKLLQKQGFEVVALRFITPFFGWQWKGREEEFKSLVRKRYGFRGEVYDITPEYLKMLAAPRHGYGSGFNPCVDCKILMLRKAAELQPLFQAQVLATGEVVGQRPMSQQRHTLRHIEKEAGLSRKILRPLSAKKLPPTEYEEAGLVDRDQLLAIAGRGRKEQLALAEDLGLQEIPSPAGGCLLTDPSLAPRIRRFFELKGGAVSPREAELLTFGRHIFLSSGGWLVLGRKEAENKRLLSLVQWGDIVFDLEGIPGPTGLLLFKRSPQDLEEAARWLKRYAPKARGQEKVQVRVVYWDQGEEEKIVV